jgi:hypothetical protein
MFSSAVSYVNQNQVGPPPPPGATMSLFNVDSGVQDQHHEAIDEDAVQDAHHQVYEKGSGGNLPASSLGSAAALQVLRPA